MHILIPSSDPNLTQICLRSVVDRDERMLERVVIITDDPDAFRGIAHEFPINRILHEAMPFNFARWMNTGIREMWDEADSFFLLNDDTELLTDHGLSLMEALVELPDAPGILSAAIRGTGGVIEQRQQTPRSMRIMPGHISFTAVAIAKRVLEEHGLLDERFVGYGYEDNDLCERAQRAGQPVAVFDGCVIGHWKPHTTFSRGEDFSGKWLLNETLFWEKWGEPQRAVVVVGGSRSGASVVCAMLDRMNIEMPDKPAPFEKHVSGYYRDDRLARAVKKGDLGCRNYIAGRDMPGKPWGTRIWPNPEGAIRFLSAFRIPPLVLFVIRGHEARVRSHANAHGQRYDEAKTRLDMELEGERRIREWAFAHLPQENIKTLSFHEVYGYPQEVAVELARFVGYEESLVEAADVVRPGFVVFDGSGDLIPHAEPVDFGRIAVGVRLTHPEAAFVGCYARLLREGLRDGDVLLEPAIRTPSHWAASTLMRRFLSSDCDTLLLVDDDMTFGPELLTDMRDKPDNWRFDIVSALATQRIPPPRALVLRLGPQPDLPDALNGLYYNMIVEGVVPGETLPVDGTGFAFTLIRRTVVEAMTDPDWGPTHTQYVSWGQGGEGEDVNFCRRAGSLGFRVAVDAAAHVGHIGSVVYGYDEFEQWRNQRTATGLPVDRLIELVESAIPSLSGDQLATAVALVKQAREQI